MKQEMKLLFVMIGIALTTLGCQSKNNSKTANNSESDNHEVIAEEIVQVTEYTYLRVKEKNNEIWIAAPKMEAKVGATYYYDKGFQITNFKSKDLNRTFDSITFVEGLNTVPIKSPEPGAVVSPGSAKSNIKKIDVSITPVDGGISISDLYAKKVEYAGKLVTVRGQVTKFTPDIMGKNWIHLQDGSDHEGNFDLTVTSNINVNPGDIVTLKGEITLNKDLGYGYFFDVIMENAIVL